MLISISSKIYLIFGNIFGFLWGFLENKVMYFFEKLQQNAIWGVNGYLQ